MVAVAAMSSAFVWACQGDPADADGSGGQGGEGTGGAGTGGAGTGGAGTGGAGTGGDGGALGGAGGAVTCESEDGSEAWGGAGGIGGGSAVIIFGDWTVPAFGGTYSFDAEVVDSGYATYDVVGYSEAGQYVVARNSESTGYYPCLYSRFDWTEDGGDVYLCRTVLDAGSVEEALARPAADRENLTTGCSGFPWSQLSPE